MNAVREQSDPVRLGVYKHYKGRYYQILGIARHSETEEKLVIYIPLYVAGGPRMAARPLSNFTSYVVVDGESKKRFEYIGIEIPEFSV